jgi:pectin lyase
LLHAVNNYFYDNSGHAFSIAAEENGRVIAEGNVFEKVKKPIEDGDSKMFAPQDAQTAAACESPLGYKCEVNVLSGSGTLTGSETSFLGDAKGEGVTPVPASEVAASVKANAGVGKL